MATTINATDIRRQFAQVAKKVEAGEAHVVTRHNKVMFAIISGADYELFQKLSGIKEQLEIAVSKMNATPAKEVVVTLPPTMYKMEVKDIPVESQPVKVEEVVCEVPPTTCIGCGTVVKVGEGEKHGCCPKTPFENTITTADEKGLTMSAEEADSIAKEDDRTGVVTVENGVVKVESKGLFTGD